MQLRVLAVLFSSAIISISLTSASSAGPTPEQKCLSKKLKEAGKYDSCRLKAEAKAVIKEEPADLARCTSKLTNKWATLDSSGNCTFTGDQPDFELLADPHTDAVVDLLTNGPPPVCGDGVAAGGEDCDMSDLAGETCISLGFDSGVLACDGFCLFDTSACVLAGCGNGTVDVSEQCDGSDLNGYSCVNLGFSFGVGTLACGGGCAFDTSGCIELCGDGTRDAGSGESCDGADLGGADCTTFGGTGTLACASNCQFDFSSCSFTCGDGTAQVTEECDGSDLQGESCSSLDFVGGTLGCTGSCTFDTSGCTATCGDAIVSTGAGEECDGVDLGDAGDCEGLGYTSGTLSCTGGCLYDDSGCTLDCDYLAQDCPGGDGCYFSIGGTGGCLPAGTSGLFAACAAQNDCLPRHYCVPFSGTTDICLPLCDSTIGDADCPAGYTCFETDIPADPDVGICIVTY